MESSWEWQLNLVQWQLFLHLTFRELLHSAAKRKEKIDKLIWAIANSTGIHADDLAVVVRFENGELTDRPHCHAVIARLPMNRCTTSFRFTIKGWWEQIAGFARVNRFDASLTGRRLPHRWFGSLESRHGVRGEQIRPR